MGLLKALRLAGLRRQVNEPTQYAVAERIVEQIEMSGYEVTQPKATAQFQPPTGELAHLIEHGAPDGMERIAKKLGNID